jgi:hypothetical protein
VLCVVLNLILEHSVVTVTVLHSWMRYSLANLSFMCEGDGELRAIR